MGGCVFWPHYYLFRMKKVPNSFSSFQSQPEFASSRDVESINPQISSHISGICGSLELQLHY